MKSAQLPAFGKFGDRGSGNVRCELAALDKREVGISQLLSDNLTNCQIAIPNSHLSKTANSQRTLKSVPTHFPPENKDCYESRPQWNRSKIARRGLEGLRHAGADRFRLRG